MENNRKPIQVDEFSFEAAVIESKQPVLVAFLATWSRPCSVIAPVLDEIAAEHAGKFKVVRVDADANPALSLWYDVASIPTLLFFVAGNVRGKIVGTASKEAILSRLQTSTNNQQPKERRK